MPALSSGFCGCSEQNPSLANPEGEGTCLKDGGKLADWRTSWGTGVEEDLEAAMRVWAAVNSLLVLPTD